jgi:hypothetical protein
MRTITLSLVVCVASSLLQKSFHRILLTTCRVSSIDDSRAEELPKSSSVTELPKTFDDAIDRAVASTVSYFHTGRRARLFFDTSVGDMTYTSLKNTLPFIKGFSKKIAEELALYPLETLIIPQNSTDKLECEMLPEEQGPATVENKGGDCAELRRKRETPETDTVTGSATTGSNIKMKDEELESSEEGNKELEKESLEAMPALEQEDNTIPRTMRIFFPDMGAAALQRRDWKIGTFEAQVPACVVCANIQKDDVQLQDELVIMLCPQHYEADNVKRVQQQCDEMNKPSIMINPNLISGDQGFGTRARLFRNEFMNTFSTTYKLTTMPSGAVVREWPRGFSVWAEDEEVEHGYTLLETFVSDPPRQVINDLYDVFKGIIPVSGERDENPMVKAASELASFFEGLSKM